MRTESVVFFAGLREIAGELTDDHLPSRDAP